MAKLIQTWDVFSNCNITSIEGQTPTLLRAGENLGSLPALYNSNGQFVSIVNSYFFDLKAVSRLKDISSNSRALLKYWSFLESKNIEWNKFPPIKHLKPTYMFRSFLLSEVENYRLSQSTANSYINHVKNFYIWAIQENIIEVTNEKESPFKIEKIKINTLAKLAHLQPNVVVDSSDLRIKVAKNSQTNNIRSLSPLSRDDLESFAKCMSRMSREFQLQCLLALLSGFRIQEVCSLTIDALNTAYQVSTGKNRFEIIIGPSTGVSTKFGKERAVEIPGQLLARLKRYAISERRLIRVNKLKNKILSLKNDQPNMSKTKLGIFWLSEKFEPFFISEQGNPASKASVNARWTEMRKIIRQFEGSFNHKFHDLRATYGTFRLNDMLEASLQPVEALELLMGWMGHNQESTTWKYLKYLKRKEALREKFAILDSIMHEAVDKAHE